MSYILDALRKSELERQLLAGQSLSAPSLVPTQKKSKPGLMLWLVVILSLAVVGLMSWIFIPPASVKKLDAGPTQDTSAKQAPSEFIQPHKMTAETLPEHIVQGIDLTREQADEQPKKIFKVPHRIADRPQTSTPAPFEDAARNVPTPAVATREKSAEENTASKGDPLKGLPPLNISGYIHTEQGVGIAMINNQLVREGDEISPGLRLVKVLDDSAVFNYKGYIFTR